MSAYRSSTLLVGILLTLTVGIAGLATHYYPTPFPPLSASLSSPVTRLSDFAGIAMGFRKLAADLAWVQTVIYYGTHEEGTPEEEQESGGGRYPLFLAYCQRVTEIDPNYKYVYYYGSAALGWNLNRLNEAEELLMEGIKAHPKEWRFQQFLAGLAYQKNHDINNLMEFLKGFVQEPDCPNLLRSILANLYKKQHRYLDAIHVWMMVYDTGDPNYLQRAASQIDELSQKAQLSQKNRS